MSSLQGNALNFNKNFSFDFAGGNLSSDSGLIMVRSFIEKLGLRPLLEESFDDSVNRKHSRASIIEQLIYTTIAGYSSDFASNALRHDPIFTGILGKDALASQPTISRFINDLDEQALNLSIAYWKSCLKRAILFIQPSKLSWIWTPHYSKPLENKKTLVLTSTILPMDIIRSCSLMA